MRISVAQHCIFAGLFHLIIAITYALICVSNYSFEWLNFEFIKSIRGIELLKLYGDGYYTADLTWGLAGFHAIIFVVHWVIWQENENERKPDLTSNTFGIGVIQFLLAMFIYYMIDYTNYLIFALTGSFAALSLALIVAYETRDWKANQIKT